MRYSQLLLEFNVEITAKKLGEKIRSKFERFDFDQPEPLKIYDAYRKAIGAPWKLDYVPPPGYQEECHLLYRKMIIEALTAYDPTPNKMYSRWICERYASGGIPRWDDLIKVRNALSRFHSLKASGYFKRNPDKASMADIGRFDSLSTLGEFIYDIPDEDGVSNAARDRQMEEEMVKTGDVTILLNSDRFKVVIPHSETAASHFGRNTQWCTTSENGGAFKSYARQGPLFIILDKPVNKRWQFHYPTEQFMDENDRSILNIDNVIGPSFPEDFWPVIPKEMVQENRFFNSIPPDKISLLPEDVWKTLGHTTAQWIAMHPIAAVAVLAQAPESYVAEVADVMSWGVILTTMAMHPNRARLLEQYLSADDHRSKDVSQDGYVIDFYSDYASAVVAEIRDNGTHSAWMKDFANRIAKKELVQIPDMTFSIERVGKTVVLQDGENRYFLCSVNNAGTQEMFAIALEGTTFKRSGYMHYNTTIGKMSRARKTPVFDILSIEIETALYKGLLEGLGLRS